MGVFDESNKEEEEEEVMIKMREISHLICWRFVADDKDSLPSAPSLSLIYFYTTNKVKTYVHSQINIFYYN